jgi:hypothetical protein
MALTDSERQLVEKYTVPVVTADNPLRACRGCLILSHGRTPKRVCYIPEGETKAVGYQGVYPGGPIHPHPNTDLVSCDSIKILESKKGRAVRLTNKRFWIR